MTLLVKIELSTTEAELLELYMTISYKFMQHRSTFQIDFEHETIDKVIT